MCPLVRRAFQKVWTEREVLPSASLPNRCFHHGNCVCVLRELGIPTKNMSMPTENENHPSSKPLCENKGYRKKQARNCYLGWGRGLGHLPGLCEALGSTPWQHKKNKNRGRCPLSLPMVRCSLSELLVHFSSAV